MILGVVRTRPVTERIPACQTDRDLGKGRKVTDEEDHSRRGPEGFPTKTLYRGRPTYKKVFGKTGVRRGLRRGLS